MRQNHAAQASGRVAAQQRSDAEGAALVCTREPGGTPLGRSIRELLLHTADQEAPAPTAELLLYAADRAQHVETLIRPALERGDWVLSDRFSGSTAYQGFGRDLDRDLIQRLEQIATTGLQPDLTLVEPSVQESLQRRRGDKDDRIEAEEQHSWSESRRVLRSWRNSAPGALLPRTRLPPPSVRLWNANFRSIWLERAV